MDEIPWNDEAVAVRQVEHGHRGERVIVAQGSLATVIDQISWITGELHPSLAISLSDRRVPPFQYDLREIGRLIARRRRARSYS